ncbi:MAG: 2-oxoacid:acceptor oxidoreductase family protein, partial [Chromatocurvus sp.]
ALVAMAAHIEGKGCATMNQTGLAQKFGAVVSHVRVSAEQEDIKAVRIPAGEADLLLGCDLVVTSTYEALGKVAQGRTHAVVNDAEVPTSSFIMDPDARFPTEPMRQRIRDEAGDAATFFFDATRIATQLLGDSIASNLFLLGYAWQQSLVPVSAEALAQAIELNGVAINFNKQAFLWGRRYAHQPERVMQLVDKLAPLEPGRLQSVDDILADRVQRLTEYQDAAYAERYRSRVEQVRAADPRSGEPGSLTVVVARTLFKLMAYKDKYKITRLYSDGQFQKELEQRFEGDYQLRFHLAPPLLSKRDPHTGHLQKREFGPWLLRAFGLLAKLRFLRGGPLDIFGRTAERRQERADIVDYTDLLDDIVPLLTDDNYATAVELAALPAKLRGFGHIKDRNREQIDVVRHRLVARLRGEAEAVQFVDAA